MSSERPNVPDEGTRVSTLELFFDLVFVFTLTQMTRVLSEESTMTGLARVALVLGLVWWMYGGYAWLTNAVPLDGPARQMLLLSGMATYLVLALTIPTAFAHDGTGLAFGLAYLVIVVIHAGLFTRASGRGARGILRIAPFNVAGASLVVAGGAIGGAGQYWLWAAAFILEWLTPRLVPPSAFFEIEPSHFVERHGLVVIVALGESVVAVGVGASSDHVTVRLIAVAVMGLALNACLFWAYFGRDDHLAEDSLRDAADQRAGLALRAFGWWHLPLLLGVIAVAFGLEHAFDSPYARAALAPTLGLGAGTGLFLVSDVLFRHVLGIGHNRWRAAAAAVSLATIPIGRYVAPAAQIGALVVCVGAAMLIEGRTAPRTVGSVGG